MDFFSDSKEPASLSSPLDNDAWRRLLSVSADASSSVLAVWTAPPLTGEDSTAAHGNLGVGTLSLFFFFFSSRADAGRSVMFPQTQIQTSARQLLWLSEPPTEGGNFLQICF